jgi:two-component system response regulator FixJ
MTKILVFDDTILTSLLGLLESCGDGGNDTVVAIVHDENDVGEVLCGLLELVGYRAMLYGSGQDFLEAINLADVSCLVVEQGMPEMTGLELLARLRSMGLAIPSLLITACDDETVSPRASRVGVTKVMANPVPFDLLPLNACFVG